MHEMPSLHFPYLNGCKNPKRISLSFDNVKHGPEDEKNRTRNANILIKTSKITFKNKLSA